MVKDAHKQYYNNSLRAIAQEFDTFSDSVWEPSDFIIVIFLPFISKTLSLIPWDSDPKITMIHKTNQWVE